MSGYTKQQTMRVVRTTHLWTIFNEDTAKGIREALENVPATARVTLVEDLPNSAGVRITFVEETESP